MTDEPPGWTEADSRDFLAFGRIITPSRDEQASLLASLVPADEGEAFRIVELGCGDGGLAAAMLRHFPRATYLGLDGSPTMLRAAAERLEPFGQRVTLRSFRLEDEDAWRAALAEPTRCVLSSLVVHHLSDNQKRHLFQVVYHALEPGGAILLVDLVLPTNPRASVVKVPVSPPLRARPGRAQATPPDAGGGRSSPRRTPRRWSLAPRSRQRGAGPRR